jgi:hypothetical protein
MGLHSDEPDVKKTAPSTDYYYQQADAEKQIREVGKIRTKLGYHSPLVQPRNARNWGENLPQHNHALRTAKRSTYGGQARVRFASKQHEIAI